jgi:hypothetical protein
MARDDVSRSHSISHEVSDDEDSDDELANEGQEIADFMKTLKGKTFIGVMKIVKIYNFCRADLEELDDQLC